MSMSINHITPANEVANTTATVATIRAQDFELRTLSAIERAAYNGRTSIIRTINIPWGVQQYNNFIKSFLKRLREAGYAAVEARKKKNFPSDNYRVVLIIGWGMSDEEMYKKYYNDWYIPLDENFSEEE